MIHDDIIILMASELKARLWSEHHIILGLDVDKVAKILEDAMPQEFEIRLIDEGEPHTPVDLSKEWTGNKKQDVCEDSHHSDPHSWKCPMSDTQIRIKESLMIDEGGPV